MQLDSLTSSRNFTTDKGVFVDEFSLVFDIFLWFELIHSWNIFAFTIFTIDDWTAIEAEKSEFPKSRHEQLWKIQPDLDWSGALDLLRVNRFRSWVLEAIYVFEKFSDSTIERKKKKHNFQGEYFAIDFSLVNPFRVRNRAWDAWECFKSFIFKHFALSSGQSMNIRFFIDRSMENLLRLYMRRRSSRSHDATNQP